LTDLQISENILLLLFAGHDTSSSTLTQAMANMADTPHVLPKLREEQQRLQEKYGPQITPAVLKDMPYADAVIKYVVARVC
jgi:cytochrome P450